MVVERRGFAVPLLTRTFGRPQSIRFHIVASVGVHSTEFACKSKPLRFKTVHDFPPQLSIFEKKIAHDVLLGHGAVALFAAFYLFGTAALFPYQLLLYLSNSGKSPDATF